MSASDPPSEGAVQTERVSSFSAFSNPGYPLFWSASVLASMGIQMQTVIGQWQVYSLTHSALQLGLVGLMNVLPFILFGVFGGALADMTDRRKLVAISQVMRIAVVLSLGVLTLTGLIQVWQVYVGGLIGSLASAFDQPARQAMIFSLVPRHHLMNAVTWHNVQRDTAGLVGPALAGAVMGIMSIDAAYFVNGLLFVPLIVAMLRIPRVVTAASKAGAASLLRDGFAFLKQTPVITTSLTLDFCLSFFGAYRGILAVFAKDILAVGPQGFGLLSSAVAVGGITGSAFVLRLGDSRHKGQLQLTAMLVYAAAVVAFGVSAIYLVSVALASILGFCDTVAGTMRRSLIQLATPEDLQGRVGAVQGIVASSGPSLGSAQAGTVASLIGAPAAVVVGGAICGVSALTAWFRSRAFREA